jgi:hypothetical protein
MASDFKRRRNMSAKAVLLAFGTLVVVHISIPTATDMATRSVIRFIIPRSAAEPILRAWECSVFMPVFSADGAVETLVPDSLNCAANERTIRTAPLDVIEAKEMRLYLQAMEGDYQASWETVSGINLKGWLLAPIRHFKFGGSNPLETAIKNLRGIPGALTILSKLENGLRVIAFTAHFLPDAASRDKFVTQAVPCARGAIGSRFRFAVAGNLCPVVLFNKRTAAELTAAERCYWAASAQRLVRIVGRDTPTEVITITNAVADLIRVRAITCISRVGTALGWTDVEIEAGRAAVARLNVQVHLRTTVPAGFN